MFIMPAIWLGCIAGALCKLNANPKLVWKVIPYSSFWVDGKRLQVIQTTILISFSAAGLELPQVSKKQNERIASC
jgi:hypothetical protein